MQEVALYKYHHHLPIVVPEVEQLFLLKVKEDADRFGLPIIETQNCLALQMQLAVNVQLKWHHYWDKKGFPNDAQISDLDKIIRPELIRITAAIVEQIAKAKSELIEPEQQAFLLEKIDQIIDVPFVTEQEKEAVFHSLVSLAKSLS
jgi:chorismate mutase